MKKGNLQYCFHIIAGKRDENQVGALAWNNSEKQRKRRADRIHSILVIPDNKTVTSFILETKKWKKSLAKEKQDPSVPLPTE